MSFVHRKEICSGCLEYKYPLNEVSDDCIKLLFKGFTNNFQDERPLYLCYYCRHTLGKISKFKSMCLQSYLFLTKNLDCLNFDSTVVEEEKKITPNSSRLSRSNIVHVSLTNNDFSDVNNRLITFNYDEEILEPTQFIKIEIKEERIDYDSDTAYDENEIELKQEVTKSTTVLNSKETRFFNVPIEKNINLENVTKITLSREEQTKNLEEKKQSKEYLEAIYKCEDCAEIFDIEIGLKIHLRKHEESRGPHECWLCHIKCSTKRNLSLHSLIHSTRLLCKLCNYECHHKKIMKEHLEAHAGATYPCKICDKVFNNRRNLSSHMGKHKIDKTSKNLRCEYCEKTFYSKYVLQTHTKSHFRTEHRFSCESCGKVFKTKQILYTHKKTVEHYCGDCDVYFTSEYGFKDHLEDPSKHKNPSFLGLQCNECPNKYESEEQINSHIQTKHGNLRFLCDICGAIYTTRVGVNFHKRTAHQGFVMPSKYECSTCNKSFKSKTILTTHIRTHTGERPFECNLCDWTFTQKAALRTHVKLKHSKEKRKNSKKNES